MIARFEALPRRSGRRIAAAVGAWSWRKLVAFWGKLEIDKLCKGCIMGNMNQTIFAYMMRPLNAHVYTRARFNAGSASARSADRATGR